jgi:chloramphenicol-sensitive protein RarD
MAATSLSDEPCETPPAVAAHAAAQASRQGVICGVLSYGCWGLIPLYFKLVAHVAAGEVLAQRVFWSFVLLGGVVTVLGRWRALVDAMRSRPILLALSASTLLLALNWFTYIYAVSTNQVVEASLGYFLNPLVNVVIGVTVLHERLRAGQLVAVVLASIGMVVLGVPLIAVTLAVSFAFYGLLRKTVAVDGLTGLLVETILLAPVALAYIVYLHTAGRSAFVIDDPKTCALLTASGVVTAVPLLLFTAAARRLRFSTLGFLQYLAPTIQFLLAVLVFHEVMTGRKWFAMALIWTAVAIYLVDSLRALAQHRAIAARPEPADV